MYGSLLRTLSAIPILFLVGTMRRYHAPLKAWKVELKVVTLCLVQGWHLRMTTYLNDQAIRKL